MRVLWVATKPPLPADDGGRLVTVNTLEALARLGVGGVVLAPAKRAHVRDFGPWRIECVPAARRWTQLAGVARVGSITLARHLQPGIERAVARVLDAERIDVVHAEQLQAIPQCSPAVARGVPVVLRAQNVEHEIASARSRGAVMRLLMAVERRRLLVFEARAAGTAAATVALTQPDVALLAALSGRTVHHVPAPFPERLLPGPSLSGAPAVVTFGSAGWFPNVDGAAWFVRHAWPAVAARVPGARLHMVGLPGAAAADVRVHPAPRDSATAFADGGILVVPSRVTTGVRMKILEAWARGMVVVATPEAARGLESSDGDALMLARDGAGFADAVARLHDDAGLVARLRAAGRAVLRTRHDPGDVAGKLVAVYQGVRDGISARPTADRPTAVPAAH